MGAISITNKNEFTKYVSENDKVVLVDFWAEWCPPCRAMAPVLEHMARQHDATLDVVKVNIEESPENRQLAIDHGVQGIPNMVVYKDGVVVKNLVGMRPAPVLENELRVFFPA